MARPTKNNLDYFPHDNSMRNDRKIKALRAKFQNGYAIYNMLLETLCEADLLIIKWNETEKELISGDFNIVSDELTMIIEYLIKINLLKQVNEYLFCPQLDIRSDTVFGKRTDDLNSLRIRNGINLTETTVSESEIPQSKVKESKVKEYIYTEFYDEQLALANQDQDYLKFVKYLFGDNKIKRRFSRVLKMKDQLTYDQFNKLQVKVGRFNQIVQHESDQIHLRVMLDNYENGKYNNDSVYLTFNNWINMSAKRVKILIKDDN